MNPDRAENPRAAIYARYSSDLQNPRSIDDQVHVCRARVRDLGGVVTEVYRDPARTGTTMRDRPALKGMMTAARAGLFDVVVAEALDRISRDQEDICHIYKRLRFHDIGLLTLEDGEITAMHVGIRGLMNEAYIHNMSAKVSRGLHGAARTGRVPGRLSYGYRTANRLDERGQVIRGLREIDPDQAEVVRRIFSLYAAGLGGGAIARILNRERIPAPGGKHWTPPGILGDPGRRTGLLHNDLYRGLLVFGVRRTVRDPDTGKPATRLTPPSRRTVQEVPHLRIVDDDLWAAVQARHHRVHTPQPAARGGTPRPLTPLVRCGRCGGPMRVFRTGRYSCLTRRRLHACDMKPGIAVTELECHAVSALRDWVDRHAADAGFIDAALRDRAERRALCGDAIRDAERRRDRLLDAVESGRASPGVRQRIDECENSLHAAHAALTALPALPDNPPPAVARELRKRLRQLHRDIHRAIGEKRLLALHRLRGLLDRIDVSLGPRKSDVDIAIHPRRDALVAFALAPADDPGGGGGSDGPPATP